MPSVKNLADLPSLPGAYVVMLDIGAPLSTRIGKLGNVNLAPGRYAYVGSARGPGGIGARVRRHARRDKTRRWHIDWITCAVGVAGVAAYVGGDECALGAALIEHFGASTPIDGLGSTDCARCVSHFLRLPANLSLSRLSDCPPLKWDAGWVSKFEA